MGSGGAGLSSTRVDVTAGATIGVDLWYLFTDGMGEPALTRLGELLSASERTRAKSFRFERDRRSYLLAHALLRATLSAEVAGLSELPIAPIAPAEWTFTEGAGMKPEILGPGPARLSFNISHTTGLVACGIAYGQALGVDVEHHEFRGDPAEVARTSFAVSERRFLASLSGDAFRRAFFALWTLKEATLKARGVGLSMPLDDFAFDLSSPDGPAVSFFGTIEGVVEDAAAWQFLLHEPGPGHTMALACRNESGAPLPVRIREGSALLKTFL